MRLGLHLSIRRSISRTVDMALEKGCNTLQFFSRNPRGWSAKSLDTVEVERFRREMRGSGIWPVVIHTPYLLNLASPKQKIYQLSVNTLKDELWRANELKVQYVVTHLGSHLGHGKKSAFEKVINAINQSLSTVKGDVMLLLENNSGTKNSVGSSFEDVKYITSRVEDRARVGVCFDTCHAFVAGYDLASKEAVKQTVQKLDEIIGFNKLKVVHLNDSKRGLGSRTDRHEHIGLGMIGERGMQSILKSRLGQLPLILETPLDKRRNDVENLKKVQELAR